MVVVAIAASVFILRHISTLVLVIRDGDTGKELSSYPVRDGDEFSITFVHSVNKSPVTDVYKIRGKDIFVERTIYYAFGAGVQTEIEEGQSLEYGEDGSMIVTGFNRRMERLSYIVGTVSDHILKVGEQTVSLRELCGKNTAIRFYCEHRLFPNLNTGSK